MSTAAADDILSWTNQDPRESQLFNSWGVLYRFQTNVNPNGTTITTLWRAIRANKEDRVAKLEWAANGGLGRVVIGKVCGFFPKSGQQLERHDRMLYPCLTLSVQTYSSQGCRIFNGPDGLLYRWLPGSSGSEIVLQDSNGAVIAYFQPTRPTRYQIGDVYGELHFLRTAGAGTVMHPPMMDIVTITAMLYRFCALFHL